MSPFKHFLSYGATDQETVRELNGHFDGLLVPGTVAAFQRDGTGGFVLALSATAAHPPYVIDPRFPLFQQPLPAKKKSHVALAEILGVPSLVRPTQPEPSDFTDAVIDTIAMGWVAFNTNYQTKTSKFEKYAKRLKEPVDPAQVAGPECILAPYTIASGTQDDWWELSTKLITATRAHAADAKHVRRVIATDDARALDELIASENDQKIFIWVSGLNELEASSADLLAYATAIRAATSRGQDLFALYGGFFSVLLASVGLTGASHGIGYGESREWLELPQSGPPPARYYLPLFHRYGSQEIAYQLWLADTGLAECACPECNGQPPIDLDYHSLMKHSVYCRAQEIQNWSGLATANIIERLEIDQRLFGHMLDSATMPEYVLRAALSYGRHFGPWIEALKGL